MSAGDIAAAVHDMLVLTLLLATPFLLASILTSFVVGLLQAGTRINDLTLSFVPRFAATMLAVYLAAPWALARLMAYLDRAAAAARALGG